MVWVDSYFPCVPSTTRADGSHFACDYRPLFASCKGEREAWLMVIEKALAF